MLFALGFISTFLIGGLTGLFLGNVSVDIPLSNTYFVVAHFHMVMGVSPVLAVFGGLYHWYPKVTGRMYHEGLARLHFWITFVGAYAIFFPMHYLGLLGMPRRYYAFDNYNFIPPSAQSLNAFITVAALLVGLAQLLFLANFAWSAWRGRPAGPNPWRAASLEWQTPQTPPVHGNWGAELPVVYRGPYAYGLAAASAADAAEAGAAEVVADYLPQNVGPDEPDEDEARARPPGTAAPLEGGQGT
jgi:cytochrome c oxidase subunit 1